jgi:methyl-accepting chemotaxis protein
MEMGASIPRQVACRMVMRRDRPLRTVQQQRALQEPPTQGIDSKSHLSALTALRKGDLSVRLPLDWTGVAGKVADTFNEVIELNERTANELKRISIVVGREGKINERASVAAVSGCWKNSLDCVNTLIGDLVHPTSETRRVIGAVAQGDLSQSVALEIGDRQLQGEFLRTARTINKMVDQLGSFASEVTRVAREVGTEGKLGGQADVKGVAGTWKDLTDSVNSMARNLTGQVRDQPPGDRCPQARSDPVLADGTVTGDCRSGTHGSGSRQSAK